MSVALRILTIFVPCVAGVGGVLAWLVFWPQQRPGPYDYWQLVLGSVGGVSLILIAAVACCPLHLRRPVGMRVVALCGAIAIVLLSYEVLCYALRPKNIMNNPWYLGTGQAVEEANERLPYVRPAHFTWTGPSAGDLAAARYLKDPYATEVTFRTDHEGFRNGHDLTHAEVIFIGDSYTEAGNVPEADTFVQQVGRKLGKTVRNLGRAGYCPPTELIVLQDQLEQSKPKVVVWQIAEANDLRDTVAYHRWLRGGRPSYLETFRRRPERLHGWMRRSLTFRVYRLVRRVEVFSTDWAGTFKDDQGQDWPMRFRGPPNRSDRPDLAAGFSELLDAIQAGHDQLEKDGIRLLVVVIPTKFRVLAPTLQFDGPIAEKLNRAYGLSAPDWSVPPESTLTSCLTRRLRPRRITCIDATPVLRASAKAGVRLYPPNDTHLSTQGHQVLSDVIVEHIEPWLAGT